MLIIPWLKLRLLFPPECHTKSWKLSDYSIKVSQSELLYPTHKSLVTPEIRLPHSNSYHMNLTKANKKKFFKAIEAHTQLKRKFTQMLSRSTVQNPPGLHILPFFSVTVPASSVYFNHNYFLTGKHFRETRIFFNILGGVGGCWNIYLSMRPFRWLNFLLFSNRFLALGTCYIPLLWIFFLSFFSLLFSLNRESEVSLSTLIFNLLLPKVIHRPWIAFQLTWIWFQVV